MTNQNKTEIGLIGLAVMGENLALNMENKGWHVSVYNRTVPGVEEGVVDRFMNGRAKGKNIEGFTDIKAFVDSIATPRKIMMMVRAGSAMDALMELCRLEGIIAAIESAHALAYAKKKAKAMHKEQGMIVCLPGRGDKDVHTIADYLAGRDYWN